MSSPPDVKIIAISNVYCRNMHFKKTGDVEEGHCHTYDHGTLIATGKALIEMLDDNYNVIGSKEFEGPSLAFINKNRLHRITALKVDAHRI